MCEKSNSQYRPKIDFSDWNENALTEFQRLMEDNLVELRKTYEHVCSRINNIISVNGVIITLLFVALYEGSRTDLEMILLFGIGSIAASTIIAIIGTFFWVKIEDQYDYTDEDLIVKKQSALEIKKVATNTTIDMIDSFSNINDIKHALMLASGLSLMIGILTIGYVGGLIVWT